MAARVDQFVDWARFTDQRWHVLRRGEHFDRPPELVRKAAQMWASRNGYRCNAELSDTRISLRFLPKGD